MADTPNLFRVIVQVSDLQKAVAFYSKLLDIKGRDIRGARHYFDCGSVILALLNPEGEGAKAKPNSDCIYFSVNDLESFHARARELGCLSQEVRLKYSQILGRDRITRQSPDKTFAAFCECVHFLHARK